MKKLVKDQDQGSFLAKDLVKDQKKGRSRLLQRIKRRDQPVGLRKIQWKDPLTKKPTLVNLDAQQAAIYQNSMSATGRKIVQVAERMRHMKHATRS